ncbi:hypothetical protein B0H13DRAFT_2045923 [Mycena leptocephala]|nr:hypothetical protein B0H13DRAFT_2045923 [Mycena leptocephala]
MANLLNVDKEKEWRGLKLTPILEDEDGSNNYSEFKQKATLDLDAAGYWKYIAGDNYNPPVIPGLMSSMQVQGHNAAGNLVTDTIPGNEAVVDAAKKNAEAWLLADKKAHALIVKAVPNAKLYVVRECKLAHEAWNALKNEYEPSNALTAVTIKQQIISYQCGANEDPVNWRQLRNADPYMMPDNEFAKYLVTLMSSSDTWRYCRDSLREKVRQGDAMGNPVSSALIAPSIVSINTLIAGGKGKGRAGDAVPSVYAAGPSSHGPRYGQSSNQNDRRNEKSHERQSKRPGLYNTQQRSAPRKFCENTFCKTPAGHSKADCFSYGGGRAGKYPEGFRGRKDVHLSPEARIAARRKWQAFESSGSRFAGMVESTVDGEEEVSEVFQTVADGFAFMLESEDDIAINEEIHVNAAVLNLEVAQDDTVNHDTGASHHIFHKQQLFHDYTRFETPLDVHRFATYDGTKRQFSVSNALHIPTARCNLISGSRIDRKGVMPFASGGIVRDLYRMDVAAVEPAVEPNSGIDALDLIAAMVPSVTSLFGPGTESVDAKRLGFITV